jgi:hypothetical protein
MIKTKLFAIDDFSGGLNTRNYAKGLEPNFTPNCANVHSNLYKNLVIRNGYTVFSNTLGQTNSYGLFKYTYLSSGIVTNMLVKFTDSKMYKMDGLDATWDEVTMATAQTSNLYSATIYSTASMNYLLFSNYDLNTMQIYSGGTTTSNIDQTTLTSSRFVIAWKNHLWCLYTKENGVVYPYRLRRTNINTYGSTATDWTAGVSGYDDVITADGDYGTALIGLKANIYIFKKNSIFRVIYLGGTPLVEIKQMASIGCESPNTIKKITLISGEEYLIFLGTDNRVYIFDGYNAPQSISELAMDNNGLTPYSLDKVNKSRRMYACAENYNKKHWYVIFVPHTGSSTNNLGYIIDYYAQPFSIWPIIGVNALTCVEAEDSTGNRNLYFDKNDGITYTFDLGDSDAGIAINAYYETPKLKTDKLPYLKKAQQIQSFWKPVGNFNTTLAYRINDTTTYTSNTINMAGEGDKLGSTFVLGTSKLSSQVSISTITDIPQILNTIQFKITNNTTEPKTKLYELDLLGEPEGIATIHT